MEKNTHSHGLESLQVGVRGPAQVMVLPCFALSSLLLARSPCFRSSVPLALPLPSLCRGVLSKNNKKSLQTVTRSSGKVLIQRQEGGRERLLSALSTPPEFLHTPSPG